MNASLNTYPTGLFAQRRVASLQLAWIDPADDAYDAYLAWRDAERPEAALFFATYRAALDRDEAAARALQQVSAAHA